MERDKLIELLDSCSETEMTLIQNYILDKIMKQLDNIGLEELIDRAVEKKLQEKEELEKKSNKWDDTSIDWDSILKTLDRDSTYYPRPGSTTGPTWVYDGGGTTCGSCNTLYSLDSTKTSC